MISLLLLCGFVVSRYNKLDTPIAVRAEIKKYAREHANDRNKGDGNVGMARERTYRAACTPNSV